MKTDDSPAVRATVAALAPLCESLPGSEQYVMVHHPAFRVGKKPYVIAGLHGHAQLGAVSVNLGREMQEQLLDDARFQRTPYIGQHGWVTVAHDALRRGELEMLVTESWKRIANRKQLAQFEGGRASAAPERKPSVKTKKAVSSKLSAAKPAATQPAPRKKAAATTAAPKKAAKKNAPRRSRSAASVPVKPARTLRT